MTHGHNRVGELQRRPDRAQGKLGVGELQCWLELWEECASSRSGRSIDRRSRGWRGAAPVQGQGGGCGSGGADPSSTEVGEGGSSAEATPRVRVGRSSRGGGRGARGKRGGAAWRGWRRLLGCTCYKCVGVYVCIVVKCGEDDCCRRVLRSGFLPFISQTCFTKFFQM